MEIVLGIDNLVFVAILSGKLPPVEAAKARRIGIGLSLIFRVLLVAGAAYVVHLTVPLFTVLGEDFSWRDLILIGGGLILVFKATAEIHHNVDPGVEATKKESPRPRAFAATVGQIVLLDLLIGGGLFLVFKATAEIHHNVDPGVEATKKESPRPRAFAATVGQIVLLDLVFSIDSIITAVGMTGDVPIMIAAVIVAVMAMLIAAGPLANFMHRNPTIVMLALGFLLLIGATLIADGFGFHFPKGYIYAAMAFSGAVEGLNLLARRRRKPPK
ncbi:MAG: hypothetical protein DLM68_01325 [Hyphomicrobiales bacterium]|nr:MAG: hypothetical protein DLM68_01325 [Hyphomicrobiales bacterium]